jgi:plasmid stabilization system protein ParE
MNFQIFWSEFAEIQLDKIFEYYKKEAGLKVAKQLITKLIKDSNKLINSPQLGPEEELLVHREIQYRYLIVKNYKLIYSVDIERGLVKIADVFDTRQNPQKIDRI